MVLPMCTTLFSKMINIVERSEEYDLKGVILLVVIKTKRWYAMPIII